MICSASVVKTKVLRQFFSHMSTGFIGEEYLKECLMTMGDRWSEEMVDELFHGAPISEGLFDYNEFTRTLKYGKR